MRKLLAQTVADDELMTTGGDAISRQVTIKHDDGTDHSYFVVKWPVLDQSDAVTGFGAFSLDITERKQAEQRVLDLLESAPDAMIIVESSGQIQLVNAQAERLFGYDREELIGHKIDMLVPEHARHVHAAHRVRYANDPRVRPMGADLQLHGRRRDGTEFPVEISLSPLQTSQGKLISAAVRDISQRVRADP